MRIDVAMRAPFRERGVYPCREQRNERFRFRVSPLWARRLRPWVGYSSGMESGPVAASLKWLGRCLLLCLPPSSDVSGLAGLDELAKNPLHLLAKNQLNRLQASGSQGTKCLESVAVGGLVTKVL